MTLPPKVMAEDDLADLRDYIERGYQGALESDPHAYSGAVRLAFADYIMARFMAWHKRQCRAMDIAHLQTKKKGEV